MLNYIVSNYVCSDVCFGRNILEDGHQCLPKNVMC